MKKLLLALFLISAAGVAISAASRGEETNPSGTGQVANAGMNAGQDRSFKSAAEGLFVEKCGMCHRQFGMGTVILGRRLPADQAMLEARKNFSQAFVKMAARRGIGNMPRIPRGEVSDAQLQEIADYLARSAK